MKKIIGFSAIALAVLSGCSNMASVSVAPQASLLSDTLVVSPNDNREYKTLKLANDISACLVGSEMCIRDSSLIPVMKD